MNHINGALAILAAHRHLLNAIAAAAETVDPESPAAAAYRQASEIAGEVCSKVEPLLREAMDETAREAEKCEFYAAVRATLGGGRDDTVDDCDDAVESATSDAEPAASAAEGNDCDDEVWPGWWWESGCYQWRLLGANSSVHVTRAHERWFTFGVTREDGSTEPYGGEGHPTAGDAMLAVQRALVGGAK